MLSFNGSQKLVEFFLHGMIDAFRQIGVELLPLASKSIAIFTAPHHPYGLGRRVTDSMAFRMTALTSVP